MLKRGYLLFVLLMGSLVLAGTGLTSAADDADARAGEFIESLADKAISSLTEKDASREQRLIRFRDLLDEHFAVDTIGRWVLGRHWNDATEAERKEYLSLFEDLIVVTYVDRFNSYSGEKLAVSRTVPATGGDLLVNSQITRPAGGEPLDVAWRVRDYEGQLKIVDVIVAGVSMGQTQRSEFTSVIRRAGGQVEGLLSKLREDLKKGA
ncbi:MAG: ABC transporter substrate-binding protein [Rhodospirillales bacterium]|nr:ABC transporter substrate-binding protein [Rhodospirillales bacterium]